MAYTKKTVVVTQEDAEEVIRYGFAYDDNTYGLAIEFLQQNHPESEALKNLAHDEETGDVDFRVSQYEAAKKYETRTRAQNKQPDEDLLAAANNYVREFEARADMGEDSTVIEIDENIDPISADDSFDNLLASLNRYEENNQEWRNIVGDVLNRTEFYIASDDEEDKNYSETIWETVKTKILVNRTLNPEWQAVMRKGGDEKDEWLREEIRSAYLAEVLTQAGATKIKEPNKEQQVLGSQAHADYIAGVAQTATKTFEKIVKKNKKIEISSTAVVAGAGNAWAKLKGFIDFSEAKQLGENFIGKVKAYRNGFDAKMEQEHPKLWATAKNVAESFKASKWQTISGLVATGAVVATGAGTGMLTAYAAYMAVSSWIWPIANKKALELNRAKKTGNKENIVAWKGKEGWTRAVSTIFNNKRETKNYIIKGTVGTVFAGVAGYLANSTEAAAQLFGNSEALAKASGVAKGMIIRTQQAVVRSVGAVAGQLGTWIGDGISYLRDKTKENKAYFKQSTIGLGLAGLLAGGATWWQLHNLHGLENNALAGNTPTGSKVAEKAAKTAAQEAEPQKAAAKATKTAAKVMSENQGTRSYTFKLADLAYTDEATDGLRANKWDDTMKLLLGLPLEEKKNGVMVRTPELDLQALTEDQKAVLQEKMEYVHQAIAAHPEAFKGMTDKRLLFDAVQITSWQGVATEAKGNILRNVGEVIFKTGDANKDAAYTAFVKMILCGKKTTISDGVLTDTANLIQDNGAMTGVVGKNLVRFKLDECGQQVWIAGRKVAKKVVKKVVEETPSFTDTKVEENVPAEAPSFTDTTVNEDVPAEEQVVYMKTTKNITNGRYGATPGHEKVGGVVKLKAAQSKDGY